MPLQKKIGQKELKKLKTLNIPILNSTFPEESLRVKKYVFSRISAKNLRLVSESETLFTIAHDFYNLK